MMSLTAKLVAGIGRLLGGEICAARAERHVAEWARGGAAGEQASELQRN